MKTRFDHNYGKCLFLIFSCLSLGFGSCKKLVTVPAPLTSVNSANVYNNNATAAAVLTGIYTQMINGTNLLYLGIPSISFYAGMSSDELTLYSGENNSSYTEFYNNELSSIDVSPDFWSNIYPVIYTLNSAIEGINSSSELTAAVKQQALGEAEFMRSFCYFYLVNLYGDVPLVLTTDYKANSVIGRDSVRGVWAQIILDLKDSKILLSANYLDATLTNTTTERVRPTKWAASTLLARSYLYTGDWTDAISEADSVIGNSMYLLDTLNGVFEANSSESIWQLQPVVQGYNTPDAQLFIIPSTGLGGSYPVYLSSYLMGSFESGDLRRADWIDSVIVNDVVYYYPYKYKIDQINEPLTEYEMVFRLAELYLIRSEAEAELGDNNAAIRDLDTIRVRAGLPVYSGSVATSAILSEIYHERQVEFFSEWGHRWFDLKRTGLVNSVMGSPGNVCYGKSGRSWSPNSALYPISISQLQADPKLIQNPGY